MVFLSPKNTKYSNNLANNVCKRFGNPVRKQYFYHSSKSKSEIVNHLSKASNKSKNVFEKIFLFISLSLTQFFFLRLEFVDEIFQKWPQEKIFCNGWITNSAAIYPMGKIILNFRYIVEKN